MEPKKRKVRAKRSYPEFWKEEIRGDITHIECAVSEYIQGTYEEPQMCTYTNLIPLSAITLTANRSVFSDYNMLRRKTKKGSLNKYFKDTKSTPLVECLRKHAYSYSDISNILSATTTDVNNFINESKNLVYTYNNVRSYYNSLARYSHVFTDGSQNIGRRFSGRIWHGRVDLLNFSIDTSVTSPLVIATILPENFLAMKYEYIFTGKIDLSKVILLINRELSMTSYNKPIRNAYNKYILPQIQTLNIDAWHVPQSFINESVFLQPFQLKEKNIVKRKEEIQTLINGFLQKDTTKSVKNTFDTSIDSIFAEMSIDEFHREDTTHSYEGIIPQILNRPSVVIQTGREGAELFHSAMTDHLSAYGDSTLTNNELFQELATFAENSARNDSINTTYPLHPYTEFDRRVIEYYSSPVTTELNGSSLAGRIEESVDNNNLISMPNPLLGRLNTDNPTQILSDNAMAFSMALNAQRDLSVELSREELEEAYVDSEEFEEDHGDIDF